MLVAPHAAAQPPPTQDSRIAVLEGDTLYVKEGGLDAEWVPQGDGIKKFELDGDRIAVLTDEGALLVKEGDLDPGWAEVNTDSVTDFQIRDGRIAFTEGTKLYAVDGGLDGEIIPQHDNVKKFQLEGDRIAVLTDEGALLVKEGDLDPGWAEVNTDSVTDFQLEDDRIAYTEGTDLWALEGELDAPPIFQEGGVEKFQLDKDRVGVLTTAGALLVKGGDLEPGWATIDADSVTDFQLDGERIAFAEGKSLWITDGDLDSPPIQQDDDVTAFDLDGDRVAVIQNGNLLVKEGDLDPGWFVADEGGVTGVQLLAPTQSGSGDTYVSLADLKQIYGYLGRDTDEALIVEGLPGLNQAMDEGEINNPARIAAFLATLRNESGFRYNAGEAGNGSRYRGRGYIQLTGVDNYRSAGAYLGHDLVNDPDAAASLGLSAPVARWYWTVARANTNAHADNLYMGGVNRNIGYAPSQREDAERCSDFQAALRYYNNGELPAGHINCNR
ncbi:hypothetical protein ALI144C_36155 [Actinosynnema sp. ALI-1.44]|nr:hypothetical protein ALI144C_36155 [Actinosynnema sp. ALI-1.44]